MNADATTNLILYGFLLVVFLGILLFVGVFVFFVISALNKREKRVKGLQHLAAKIGWNYRAKAALTEIPHHLLDPNKVQSYSAVTNYLSGNLHGLSAISFDYVYKIGFSSNSTMSSYTLFALFAPHLNLPKFTLCEESFFNKMSWKISNRKDLNFAEFPNFSARFLLDAEDSAKIRQTFNPQVAAFYEQNPSFQTLSDGKVLVIAPNSGIVEAEDYEKWLNLLWMLHELFRTSK